LEPVTSRYLLRRRLPDTLGMTVANEDGHNDLFWADAQGHAEDMRGRAMTEVVWFGLITLLAVVTLLAILVVVKS
jgi:hypothetical protein